MTEPILVGLTPAAIAAAILVLANFGKAWFNLDITPEQKDSLTALLVLLIPVFGVIGAWWARRSTTPVAAPVLPTGTAVTVTGVTPPGQADPVTTV